MDLSDVGFLVSFPNRAHDGIEKLIDIMGNKFQSKHRDSFGLNDGSQDRERLAVEEQLKYLLTLLKGKDVPPETARQFQSILDSLTRDLYSHPFHMLLGTYRDSIHPDKFHKQLLRHEGCETDLSLNQWKSFFSLEWISCVVKMGISFVLLGREVPKTTVALLEILKDCYPPISEVEEFARRSFEQVIFLCFSPTLLS